MGYQRKWKDGKTSTQIAAYKLASVKATSGQPDPVEYIEKKAQLEELKKLDAAGEIDLYYLDETGLCLIPCVLYGWKPVGEIIAIPRLYQAREVSA